MRLQRILIGTMAALVLGSAGAAPSAVQERNGMLASSAGHTLYVTSADTPGRSTCNAGCARAWPPFLAREGAQAGGAMSVVTRDDGALQWAHAGRPLYFFAADARPGDTRGDGIDGVWSVVRVAGERATAPARIVPVALGPGGRARPTL